MRSRVITIAALALAAGTVAGTAQEFEPWEQELYEAAREEGEIIWYVSQTTSEFAETVCQAFEARYEGVDCNPIRATGSVTFQRVMQEVQAGSVQGDVYSSNDETDFVELNKVKALTAYVPNNIEHMSPSLREASNPDGYWFASNVSPYGIAYNTELVSEEEAPKNWTDLLDPKWKDQLAIAHPSFSGSMGMFAIAMRDKYGWEFFEKMEQNKPHIGRSIADGYNLVVSGERKVAVVPVSLSFAGEAEGEDGVPDRRLDVAAERHRHPGQCASSERRQAVRRVHARQRLCQAAGRKPPLSAARRCGTDDPLAEGRRTPRRRP